MRALSAALLLSALAACDSTPPEPARAERPRPVPVGSGRPVSTRPQPSGSVRAERPKPPKRKVAAKETSPVKVAEGDPVKGKWGLEEATKGLPKDGELVARIETDLGALECRLFADKAPLTVANFVGLARGVRPWKTPAGKWEKKPAYDKTTFHRIIKGFMIQGGDPLGDGTGDPGYDIPDEIWEDANHDRPGLLCMANTGPDTNGIQFFITDEAAPHLDWDPDKKKGGYTIFGECGPVEVVHAIAGVPVKGSSPDKPPVIKTVTVTRRAAPAPSGSASAGAPSASAAAPAASGAPAAGAPKKP